MESAKKRNLIIISLVTLGLIVALWIIFTGGGLLYTPQIAGKIVDAETNKPIPGAMLSTDWRSDSILDVTVNLNRIAPIVSDKDGKFCIPRVIKPINPVRKLDYLDIAIYAPGYEYTFIRIESFFKQDIEIRHGKQTNHVSQTSSRVALKPLRTEEEFWNNVEALWDLLDLTGGWKDHTPQKQAEFFIAEYEKFAEEYPTSIYAPRSLLSSGDICFRTSGSYKANAVRAIKQYNKLINRYPNSEEVTVARDRIVQTNKENHN